MKIFYTNYFEDRLSCEVLYYPQTRVALVYQEDGSRIDSIGALVEAYSKQQHIRLAERTFLLREQRGSRFFYERVILTLHKEQITDIDFVVIGARAVFTLLAFDLFGRYDF